MTQHERTRIRPSLTIGLLTPARAFRLDQVAGLARAQLFYVNLIIDYYLRHTLSCPKGESKCDAEPSFMF
jgi:hypothetical protein